MLDTNFPSSARRVFKGIIHEIWQWDQLMYDGSTQVFECIARVDSVQVIATVEDRILLQIQEQPDRKEPFLSLPGGRCDEGEEAVLAAKRELLEEMGYASDDWTLLRTARPGGAKMQWIAYTYIARNCIKMKAPHLDAGERIEEKRISFDEFLRLSDDPAFRHRELDSLLVRAQYDRGYREELRKTIFGAV